MKSTILHGDNQVLSRKKFIVLTTLAKKENLELVRLDWNKAEDKDLHSLSLSQSLLANGVCVAVENFFTGNTKWAEIIAGLDLTKTTFIFWENKALTPAIQKKLEFKFLVQEFPIPKTVFNFLDSLFTNNKNNIINLFEKARIGNPDEMLLVMMARQIRLLYWASIEPDTLTLPDWMKNKLILQGEIINKGRLVCLHSNLLELDRKAKKSQLPENLGSSLEILLASF